MSLFYSANHLMIIPFLRASRTLIPLLLLGLSLPVTAQQKPAGSPATAAAANPPATAPYRFTIDLTAAKNDRVPVTLEVPALSQTEVVYNMPKIVPGTYSIYNFGRFLTDFKALDKNGQPLAVEKLDENRWKISNARSLSRITYWVDDTFDSDQENAVFEPAGTNIEAGKNYLLNTHGFIGYFDGLKRVPYELTVQKPQKFYGSTPLRATAITAGSETFRLSSYMDVVDSPLMYTVPDTTTLRIGGADVLVSVYAPSGKVKSKLVAKNVGEILEAQKNYLGGKLPVDKYAFLIYLADKPNKSGAYGALEHSYSSVYYMPENEPEDVAQEIRSIASHEFFHIITPLSIHSTQIHDFDFNNPQMSKHLWLYEGVTEYFSTHVQVNQKLFTPEKYLESLREYIIASKGFFNDTLPFTELSTYTLDKHKKQYGNVYSKGPLIGLVLEVQLRELSGGRYSLRHLLNDLARKYGKDRAFNDEELFDQITALSYPQIREFFTRYVEGPEPLPLEETFRKVGIIYQPEAKESKKTFGRVAMEIDQAAKQILIGNTSQMNEFGRQMGYREGDRLLAINGEKITFENLEQLIERHVMQPPVGTPITVTVGRPGTNGKLRKLKLKGNISLADAQTKHQLKEDPDATPAQKLLREQWLYGTL